MTAAHADFVAELVDAQATDYSPPEPPTAADRRRFGALIERVDAHLVEPDRLAPAVIDEMILDRRRRAEDQRPLTARECLAALQYESMIVYVAAQGLRAGAPLAPDDHDRLGVAMQRIHGVVAGVLA